MIKMYNLTKIMKVTENIRYHLFLRWSYTVPVLCYITFSLMIWMLSVPLKPNRHQQQQTFNNNKGIIINNNKKPLEIFEIRMKNSNFNSDRRDNNNNGENNKLLLYNKNEYLINLNNNENANKDQIEVLQNVFKMADSDQNNKLDAKELANWIRKKIVEHISSAVSNNYGLFTLIDINPRNGVITWNEYHTYFLKKRGFSRKYVERHDEKRHKGLQRSVKEQIMKDKALWMEAARSNPDALTVDEFLAFTHPESSAANQLTLVDELYDKFDRDGDELLTEEEFAILQTDGGGGGNNEEDEQQVVVVRQDENERRAEFRNIIDLNGDGRADRRELLHYVAPQSPRHSEHEAEALLALADSDHDHMLSLYEILAHPDLFLRSKMVDTARSFHDEF